MIDDKFLLVGCGILKKEIDYLIEKNNWSMDKVLLNSALHVDFEKLSNGLTSVLDKHHEENTIVFYGCCHPLMDEMLDKAKTIRTRGQNCVDMLLGNELFTKELTDGAFFLMEDWAKRWEYILVNTFGGKPEVIREIFQSDRKYLLGLRTPCSEDFSIEAEAAAQTVGLPLRWLDVTLDHLESVLQKAIINKMNNSV